MLDGKKAQQYRSVGAPVTEEITGLFPGLDFYSQVFLNRTFCTRATQSDLQRKRWPRVACPRTVV
jgi:hypothetical protein